MSQRNLYNPDYQGNQRFYHGSPSEQRAYAREELDDAMILGDAEAELMESYNNNANNQHQQQDGGGGGGGGGGGMDEDASIFRDADSHHQGSVQQKQHHSNNGNQDTSDDHFTLGSNPAGRGERDLGPISVDADELDPARLFTILEEALRQPFKSQASQSAVAAGNSGNNSTGAGGGGGGDISSAEQQLKRDMAEQTWDRVRRWLWAHPSKEERQAAAYVRGQADAAVLHLMCKFHYPPEDVISAILEAAPDTARWTDSHGWLALHLACAHGASPAVIKCLVAANGEGKVQQDNQHRTPLHFYATRNTDNPTVMEQNATLLSDTGAAELTDHNGMLPMHYACAYGTQPAVLQVLADAYPESLYAKEHKGRTPMHFAMVNAHRDASPAVIQFLLEQAGSKPTVNTRDQDGYLPMHLLALGLKGYRTTDPEKRNNVGDCLRMYLGAEPAAAADFLTAIQDLPDWLQDTAVVSKHVCNVLNKKIVQRFPTSILMLDGYFLIILIVCFELTTRNYIDAKYDTRYENAINATAVAASVVENGVYATKTEFTKGGALLMVYLGGTYFLLREVLQFASLISMGNVGSWFTDMQNWLDMAVIVTVFYYAVCMTTNSEAFGIETFRSGVALTKGILWIAVIFFLKSTLIDFAVFVSGVFYVVQRLAAFLMAVAVILLGFAQMFFFVYVDTDVCRPVSNETIMNDPELEVCDDPFPHCTFSDSLLKVYTMMMGEIGDEKRYANYPVAQFLYVGYAFLVVILLSNVLIAVVTDTYEIVLNDRAAIVFWSNRLDFVAEIDAYRYAVIRRLRHWIRCGPGSGGAAGKRKNHQDDGTTGGAPGAPTSVQEGPNGPGIPVHDGATTHSHGTAGTNSGGGGGGSGTNGGPGPDGTAAPADGNGGGAPGGGASSEPPRTDYFYEGWQTMWSLFDTGFYEDMDMLEFWVYNIFRIFCIVLIPLWLLVGFATAGWLWPPQVREYLFVQKDTAMGRAELERRKLEQLKSIQNDLKLLKNEVTREMSNDRDDFARMKQEVDIVQSEVLADLQQIKELMHSLADVESMME